MASLQDISFTQNLTQNIGVYPTSEIEPTGVDCVQNIEAAGLAFKKVNSAKSYFLSQTKYLGVEERLSIGHFCICIIQNIKKQKGGGRDERPGKYLFCPHNSRSCA